MNKCWWIAVCIVAAGTVAAFGAQVPVVPAGSADNSITVTGYGQVKVRPDLANVTLGVVTAGRTAREAATENSAAAQKVIAAVRAAGVDEKDIQTSNYSIQAQYDNRATKPTLVGYQVSNQVEAVIHDIGNVGRVIDAATESGANSVDGVAFGLSDSRGATDIALKSAVEDATRKAGVLAHAASLQLLQVVSIHEGGSSTPQPLVMGSFRAMQSTPIQPGQVTSATTVTVVFKIRPEGAVK